MDQILCTAGRPGRRTGNQTPEDQSPDHGPHADNPPASVVEQGIAKNFFLKYAANATFIFCYFSMLQRSIVTIFVLSQAQFPHKPSCDGAIFFLTRR